MDSDQKQEDLKYPDELLESMPWWATHHQAITNLGWGVISATALQIVKTQELNNWWGIAVLCSIFLISFGSNGKRLSEASKMFHGFYWAHYRHGQLLKQLQRIADSCEQKRE